MKKMISLILAFSFILALSACGSKETAKEASPEDVQPAASDQVITAAPTSEPEYNSVEEYEDLDDLPEIGGIETNEKLLSVDITFPASFFEDEDMSDFDPDAYCHEQGFEKAVLNDDGSVTVTMTKAKHEKLLHEMSDSLDASFAEYIGSEDTPYIMGITHSDNFDNIEIIVSRTEYENTFDVTPFAVAISAMMYQVFLDMDYHVEVSVVDADTGDVINTTVYPDAFNS